LIYSDILYGTGKNYGSYKDLPSNRKIIFNFYVPRFKEFHRILKNTGSIVLQMDKRINHWVRNILDNIFGYERFLNEITWCYSGGGVSKGKFSPKSDVLVWYSKSDQYYFKEQFIPYTGIQKAHPYSKNREEKSKRGKHLEDWWIDINSFGGSTNHPERRMIGYPTQKPEKLLERVIDTFSKEGDLVADFFMGSGTSLAVAKRMNRKILGCDISKEAYEITLNRL
tara:strand:- start:76 stop:750 length:675 start_codon:yes stop_codon:yes gene_type:complete